ncbi:hypothetical protein CHARACLAT_029666 [Characodon lateralis]|uniref:Uncharacterized protein n=1 Tax=Characodon lateralis TaxID=208331 RepID=A0ABU7FA70_9TELE|nr:hypothetical protein [Characodon lateralis]
MHKGKYYRQELEYTPWLGTKEYITSCPALPCRMLLPGQSLQLFMLERLCIRRNSNLKGAYLAVRSHFVLKTPYFLAVTVNNSRAIFVNSQIEDTNPPSQQLETDRKSTAGDRSIFSRLE